MKLGGQGITSLSFPIRDRFSSFDLAAELQLEVSYVVESGANRQNRTLGIPMSGILID